MGWACVGCCHCQDLGRRGQGHPQSSLSLLIRCVGHRTSNLCRGQYLWCNDFGNDFPKKQTGREWAVILFESQLEHTKVEEQITPNTMATLQGPGLDTKRTRMRENVVIEKHVYIYIEI